jgi:hypothetical protein
MGNKTLENYTQMDERITELIERETDNEEVYCRNMWEEELMKYKKAYNELPKESREQVINGFESNCKSIEYILEKGEGVQKK